MTVSLSEVESYLLERIHGQRQAVRDIAPWVGRIRFGFRRDDRPAAVLLFLGPPDTGKIDLGKEFARLAYGDEGHLLHFDMIEFRSTQSVNSLIGAPPGLIGYGEGQLTNGLRYKPKSVIIFEDIEKADAAAVDVVRRFAATGKVVDSTGATIDGRACTVVITTSAIRESGLGEIFEGSSCLTEDLYRPEIAKAVASALYLGGDEHSYVFDQLVLFAALDKDAYRGLTDDVVAEEIARFCDFAGVTFLIDEAVKDSIAAAAHSSGGGVHTVRGIVGRLILLPAVDMLLLATEDDSELHISRLSARYDEVSGIVIEVE